MYCSMYVNWLLVCGFEAGILKAALSLLFSLRSGLSSLVDTQPEAPWLASPPGGDHGKGMLAALAELSLFFSVWESKVEARFNSGLLRGQGQWQEYSWRDSILTQVLLEDVLIRPNTEAIALA